MDEIYITAGSAIGSLIVGVLVGYWQRTRKYQAGKKLVKNAAERLTAFSGRLDDDILTADEVKDTIKDIQATASDIKDVVA